MTDATRGVGELLARLRRDGVDAGEAERARLVERATAEAEEIVRAAKEEAAAVLKAAEAEVEQRRKKLDAELRLAARDFIARFHERLSDEIIGPAIAAQAGEVLADQGFLERAILDLLRAHFAADGTSVVVTVDPSKSAGLSQLFAKHFADAVERGDLVLATDDGTTGFRLARVGASYAWEVTEEVVADELSSLVDRRLRELLVPGRAV